MIFIFKVLFLDLRWVDALDVILVAVLLYQLYRLLRGSVALKIFAAVLMFYLIYELVHAAGMELLSGILGQFMGVGVLAALILFQPEIRKFLVFVSKTTLLNESIWNAISRKGTTENKSGLTPVFDAVRALSQSNTGALIVFAGNSDLNIYINSGDFIDAKINKRLLLSLFYKNSPLHDGAVIIKDQRIVSARCVLPVSDNGNIPAELGLRHRSALGLSEQTDAFVIVISEQTGNISVALNSRLELNLGLGELRERLNDYFGVQLSKQRTTKPANLIGANVAQ